MASLHKEILIDAPAAAVWSAVHDIGALHTRLVPDFITDCRVEGEERVVTFFNGQVARESIISNDNEKRRLCWAILGGFAKHYNAVMHVIAEGDQTRVTWDSDFLPHALSDTIAGLQEAGLAAMKKNFERPKG
jgi:carbon monoxide dehydrogenase subunit G